MEALRKSRMTQHERNSERTAAAMQAAVVPAAIPSPQTYVTTEPKKGISREKRDTSVYNGFGTDSGSPQKDAATEPKKGISRGTRDTSVYNGFDTPKREAATEPKKGISRGTRDTSVYNTFGGDNASQDLKEVSADEERVPELITSFRSVIVNTPAADHSPRRISKWSQVNGKWNDGSTA